MTQQQFENRKERAENEILVIARTDEGYRVYSPAYPTNSYIVSGSPESPACTCPDFQHHEGDPQWRCKHILAVLNRVTRPASSQEPAGQYEADERQALQGEARLPQKTAGPLEGNGASQMLLKRSVSPDGRIDSLSIEFSCPVNGTPVKEIKSKALKTLKLQAEIVETFLNGRQNGKRPRTLPSKKTASQGDGNGSGGGQPGTLLGIAGLDGKWGRRLFINIQVNGKALKLFGNRKQLGEALTTAGYPHLAPHVAEGVRLNLPCRVITRPSQDGKYLNVERVLPDEIPY